MAGCCSACDRGGACEGGACDTSRSSGALSLAAERDPAMVRRRSISGSHPAARGSAGLDDILSESAAGAYRPTDAELTRLRLSRSEWDALTPIQRLVAIRGESSDAAFLQELRALPEAQRESALRRYLEQQNRTPQEVGRAVTELGRAGIDAIGEALRGDRDRDLERIRTAATTEQERIRQEAITERALIEAETERQRIAAGLPPRGYVQQPTDTPPVQQPVQQQYQQQPVQPPPSEGPGVFGWVALALAAAGIVAYVSSQKPAQGGA